MNVDSFLLDAYWNISFCMDIIKNLFMNIMSFLFRLHIQALYVVSSMSVISHKCR